ncbi:MAG TPA: efflux RND transporter periplasmic adaptor subunit [Steroidobacteraceae bacterium]|nr:efflux RND transporter periplasmic adaptor subunit [Steroidobacteraceae bacterium]
MNRIRMSGPRVVMLGAAVALTVVFFVWHGYSGGARAADKDKQGDGHPEIAVETALAGRSDVPVYLEGLGTVQAFYTVTVTARVDGELQKVGFVEGQTLKKGDLIGQIDPRPFRAALDQAIATHDKDVAQLASAQADLDRFELLAPQNLASKQTLDAQHALVGQLQAQIKGDQANIDNARTQLSYTTIVSPIQGKTGIRRVDPGNNVHATDTGGIVVVTQVQPIACIFTLPEEALPTLNRALEAGTVSVTAMSRDGKSELDSGTIALVDNQIDQTTGTIRVKATFPNPHDALWPGEFINARVLVRTEHNVLTVPSNAIQRGPNGMFTYVVKADSTVEARPLKVGDESGTLTVITDGLKDGEQVVLSNQYRLQPGARVRSVAAVVPSSARAVAPGTKVSS